jgi:hypothetical protein
MDVALIAVPLGAYVNDHLPGSLLTISVGAEEEGKPEKEDPASAVHWSVPNPTARAGLVNLGDGIAPAGSFGAAFAGERRRNPAQEIATNLATAGGADSMDSSAASCAWAGPFSQADAMRVASAFQSSSGLA